MGPEYHKHSALNATERITCKNNIKMSRSTNIEKLCNAVGIDRDEEALITYMDTTRKAPFRRDDLSKACKEAGIHVTTDMVKQEIVDIVMDALRYQDKKGNAVYTAIRSHLKEVKEAAKPKATTTAESISILDDAISKLNALKVQATKDAKKTASAAATPATSAKPKAKPAVSFTSSYSYSKK